MLTKEIIQRIQTLYSKGVQSDDSRLTSRHIYNKMVSVRAKLLTQKANKKQPISQWDYQIIPCLELQKALPYECPCIPPIGCEILRTVYKLPQPITSLNGHLLQSVTSLEGSIIYSEVSWSEKKYKSSNKYTGNKPDFFIRDNYLYITHKKGSKLISVVGLFENPLEVDQLSSYCSEDEDCKSPLDKEFPLDNSLVETLIEMCFNELIVMFSQSKEDITNNSRDNNIEQSK